MTRRSARVVAESPIEFIHEDGRPVSESACASRGVDVTAEIRTPEVDDAVSAVARLPRCARRWSAQQRHSAASDDIVVEGRDIGTVVFPDAEVKVFLTASSEERARRRAVQQAESGIESDSAEVHEAILRRDAADSTRELSPLRCADDAVELDTTGLTSSRSSSACARSRRSVERERARRRRHRSTGPVHPSGGLRAS